MKFNISAELRYQVLLPSTFILNIHALRTQHQAVITENFVIDPYTKSEEFSTSGNENRFIRFEAAANTNLNITYTATVDSFFNLINCRELHETKVSQLPPDVLVYLNPSRYCQSDKLYRLANNHFGKIKNPFEKVHAITEWIHRNVEYLSGFSNSQTSAYDTVTEQAGVCRDFAHLGIALCRAVDIPARYFTGYSWQLKPPDFHACFEAYLGNEWILFDATKLAHLNGLVKIATGRDAADTAIASIFGMVNCTYISVSCDYAGEEAFTPLFYDTTDCKGISYL